MKTYILSIALFAGILLAIPSTSLARNGVETVNIDLDEINISISGNVLHVTGAAGEALQVYNITGVRIMSEKLDSDDKRITINLPKGCYIVKVGKVVRKISIR